jgi:hypothetical protein
VHWAVLNPDNNNKRKLTEELICSTNCPLWKVLCHGLRNTGPKLWSV